MAAQNGRRLPDYLANKACNAISYRAWKNMPKVDPANVIQELEVQAKGVTAKGNLSFAKKPRRLQITVHSSSLAARIILASFYRGSPFNIKTGQVFAREKPATHGSAEFWQWVADRASRMTSVRRSATGFFAACARAINVGFGIELGKVKPVGILNESTGQIQSAGADVNKASKLLSKGLAKVYPARGGTGRAAFTVSATEPDTKGAQGALGKIALPVWQSAVDDEAAAILKFSQKAYADNLRASGLVVK